MKNTRSLTSLIFLVLLTGCGQLSDKDLIKAAYNGKTEVLENAIDAGANINLKSQKGGVSLLSNAAGAGHGLTVYMLLKKGANGNDVDDAGWSAMHFAASGGQNDVINMLTKFNVDLDLQNGDGWTPLMYAVFNNHESTVKTLLDSGASVNVVLANGLDAMEIAKGKGHSKIMNLLKKIIES